MCDGDLTRRQGSEFKMKFYFEKLLIIMINFARRFILLKGTSVCGGLLDQGAESSGVISSPHYPGSYDNETYCIWLLRARPSGAVTLTLHRLDGERAPEGHCLDYIEVRAGSADSEVLFSGCSPSPEVNTPGNTTDPPTSTTRPAVAVVESPHRWMWVLFTSDEEVSNSGFTATWTFTSNVTKLAHRSPVKVCDNTQFECGNLECISYSWVCDGYPDCGCHTGCDEHHCLSSNLSAQVRLAIGLLVGLGVFMVIVTMATYCELQYPWPPFGRDKRGYDTDIKVVEEDECDAIDNNP